MKTLNSAGGALSTDFLDKWKQKQGRGAVVLVAYKRRYLDGSDFVYEPNWTQWTMRDYVEVGQINWKLDTPLLNIIKMSNVNIRFKNSDYQMLETNTTSGFFAPDAVATVGYDPHLTMFRVLYGYRLDDGTIETVNLFTGVALEPLYDIDGGYVDFQVSGMEYLLLTADAQKVSTAVTGGATTNTAAREYATNFPGIAFITNVYAGGVLVDKNNYSISGVGIFGASAVIATNYDPVGAITYDGAYWHTLAKMEDLVLMLAQEGGVDSGASISAVTWPGQTGSSSATIGYFDGTDYASAWTADGSASGSAGVLTLASGGSSTGAYTPNSHALGIFFFRMNVYGYRASAGVKFMDSGDAGYAMDLQYSDRKSVV